MTETRLVAVCLLAVAGALIATTDSPAQSTPVLFAEGLINTQEDQYGPTFSPDGSTLYFTEREERDRLERIMVSTINDSTWSTPAVASFSGGGFDKEPYLSPDGTTLFFASNRLVDNEDRDFEIWVVDIDDDGLLGEPRHLAAVGSPAYENYPAVASSGNLYFSSKRASERNDLWMARFVDGAYADPEPIVELNTEMSDADPYIDPDERFMIFSSTRAGGFGSGDLYITHREDGKWSAPVNLGEVVNTDDYEYTPMLSPDGSKLYFSRGWGDIYVVDWDAVAPRADQAD